MARGIRTLIYLRELMNPFRYGAFAMMLVSHKLLRWLPYLVAPASFLAVGVIAARSDFGLVLFAAVSVAMAVGVAGVMSRSLARFKPVAVSAFVVAACAAGVLAWWDVLRGVRMSTWEPTTRPDTGQPTAMSAG